MRKYGLLLLSLFFIVKCQVIPLLKVAKTTGAVKTEIIATQEATKALEGTVELTKETIKVVKKVKQLQKPVAIVTTLTGEKEVEKPMSEMSEEELFAKMFGEKSASNSVTDLVVPLIINTRYGRKTKLNIINGKTYVVSEDLESSLNEFLKSDVMEKIFDIKNITQEGISLDILAPLGIRAYFDENDVAVKITINPEIIKKSNYSLSSRKRMSEQDFNKIIKSASEPLSGVSNFYLRDSFSSTDNGRVLVRAPATLNNRTFVNVYDYIIDSGLRVTEPKGGEQNVNTVNRDYTSISKDFPRSNMRVKIGDVALTNFGRMRSKNILGISLLKHYDITKRMNQSIRVNSKNIFLENESRLQIFVNDRLVRTMDLEPGEHDISDFPFSTGLNNVRIEITDILGNKRTIDFDEFNFTELLKRDVSTYGLSVGVVSKKTPDGSLTYGDVPVVSAYYNYGLIDGLTLRSGVQFSDQISSYGGELLLGSNFGLLSIFGVQSKTSMYGLGSKYGLSFTHFINGYALKVQKEVVDEMYKSIGEAITANEAGNLFSASISKNVRSIGQLSLLYQNNQSVLLDTQAYGLEYIKSFSSEWDLRASFRKLYSADTENISGTFTLSYRPKLSRLSYRTELAYANEDINEKYELNLNNNGHYGLNGVYTYQDRGSENSLQSLRANYLQNAYTINSDYSYTNSDNGASSRQGALSASSGIAFVGNKASMTQPISNSFILVKNDDRFDENPLGVVLYNENEPSSSFVMPVGDYAMKKVTISDKNLIFGAEIIQNEYELVTKYKTGKLVLIQPKFILSAKGRLLDTSQNELSRKVFKLFKKEKDGTLRLFGEENIFFTNSKGKFLLGSVEEGTYIAKEINVAHPHSFTFTIKSQEEDAQGLVNLGDITAAKVKAKAKSSGTQVNKYNNEPIIY